jgi:Tfp pilus assembly protein PilF
VLALEGKKHLEHEDFTAAEAQLRAAIAASKEAPEAWLLLSQINTNRGQEPEAKANFKKAVQLEANGAPRFRGLAASEIDPTKKCLSIGLLANAYCKAAGDELGIATKLAQQAGASDGRNPRTLYWLVQIYGRLGQKTIARMARIAPDSSGLHKLYARAFEENGHRGAAENEYDKAIAADDQDASTFIECANFRVKNQQFSQAIPLLQRALQLAPYDFNVHLLLAQAYVYNSEPASAVPYFAAVLKASPENVQLRIDLAESLYNLDRAPEGIKILEAAPADPDGRVAYVLAKYYARQGEKEKALTAMETFRQRQKQRAK